MQQNDALFQIKLLNVSVYLVSVCSVAEQTLSVCIKLLAMRGSVILGPLTRAVLMRLNFSFFFTKEIMLFDAYYMPVDSPCSGQNSCSATWNVREFQVSF